MSRRLTKRGLKKLPNDRGFKATLYPHRIRYIYIPEVGNIRRFYLEFTINEYNIIEIAFCQKNKGDENSKYRLRNRKEKGSNREVNDRGLFLVFNKIMDLCLNEFTNNHCFVFCGANDINVQEEENDRFSVYTRYISRKIPSFQDEWNFKGSTLLNTFMFYHRDTYTFLKESEIFYESYVQTIMEKLERGEI